MVHRSTLLMKEFVTHDVARFILSKPEGFSFTPGQGVTLAIDRSGWRDERRPFTPTALVDDRVVEFTIKRYAERDGVTDQLHRMRVGQRLLMSDPFGTITYRGPGTFIAAGAGITPFVAILRELRRKDALGGQQLLFSNKTPADVILEKELRHDLGPRCMLTCTRESAAGYEDRRIDRRRLERAIDTTDQRFYVCGPGGFVADMRDALEDLGAPADNIVLEQ